ncbi:MAG: hypothetical protein QNJ65_12770 [Xenococcaceae cyanobacterium MO_234.B1]|nr:hypothetical protein [Xenococcaceae cyanobacterium MO_234.B1]
MLSSVPIIFPDEENQVSRQQSSEKNQGEKVISELNWYWGYPFFWVMMGGISTSMIYFFWQKGWFRDITTPNRKN